VVVIYPKAVMPRRYPKKFRGEVCERLLAGESSIAVKIVQVTS
jgi:hypothetical protein